MQEVRQGRASEQFVVRMPPGLRDELKRQAAANRRSMNAEIIIHLERAVVDAQRQGAAQ